MDRLFNPLRRRTRMIDAGALAGCLDADRHIRTQDFAPGQSAGALVELGEMKCPEGAHARKNAAGAPEFQVRPPDLGPAAPYRHSAFDRRGIDESLVPRLRAEQGFSARKGHKENLDIAVCIHSGYIARRRVIIDIFLATPLLAPLPA